MSKDLGDLRRALVGEEDLVGRSVGSWRVLRPLGRGGMGTVYAASHVRLGREGALKLLTLHEGGSEAGRERFLRGSRLAAKLSHGNLVHVLDAGFLGDRPFIVQELVDGSDLRDVIAARAPLPPEETRRVVGAIARALAYLHERGVFHRDVKPENVLCPTEGEPQLADFDLVRPVEESDAGRLTLEGTSVGTAGYMAPEQVRGRNVDHRADLFALGAIWFELLTGAPPYGREAWLDYARRLLDGPAVTTAEHLPQLDAGDAELLAALIERDPDRRPGSAGEVLERLGAGATPVALRTTPPPRPPATKDAPPRAAPATRAPTGSAPAPFPLGTLVLGGAALLVPAAILLGVVLAVLSRDEPLAPAGPDRPAAATDDGGPRSDPGPGPPSEPPSEPGTSPAPAPVTDASRPPPPALPSIDPDRPSVDEVAAALRAYRDLDVRDDMAAAEQLARDRAPADAAGLWLLCGLDRASVGDRAGVNAVLERLTPLIARDPDAASAKGSLAVARTLPAVAAHVHAIQLGDPTREPSPELSDWEGAVAALALGADGLAVLDAIRRARRILAESIRGDVEPLAAIAAFTRLVEGSRDAAERLLVTQPELRASVKHQNESFARQLGVPGGGGLRPANLRGRPIVLDLDDGLALAALDATPREAFTLEGGALRLRRTTRAASPDDLEYLSIGRPERFAAVTIRVRARGTRVLAVRGSLDARGASVDCGRERLRTRGRLGVNRERDGMIEGTIRIAITVDRARKVALVDAGDGAGVEIHLGRWIRLYPTWTTEITGVRLERR